MLVEEVTRLARPRLLQRGQWLGERSEEWWRRTCRTAVGASGSTQPRSSSCGSFTELNAWLGQRCRELWDEVRNPEHTQFSVAEMLEHERAHLMPMPVPFDAQPGAVQ